MFTETYTKLVWWKMMNFDVYERTNIHCRLNVFDVDENTYAVNEFHWRLNHRWYVGKRDTVLPRGRWRASRTFLCAWADWIRLIKIECNPIIFTRQHSGHLPSPWQDATIKSSSSAGLFVRAPDCCPKTTQLKMAEIVKNPQPNFRYRHTFGYAVNTK